MVSKQSGFTLVEVLMVFSVFLLISSISSIFIRPQYVWVEKERFFSQFKADFLYSQQYAISNQKQLIVFIYPIENQVRVIEKLSKKLVIEREVPPSIRIVPGSLGIKGVPYMSFELSANGNVNRFGNFFFDIDEERYKITFQIGAGRLYVVRE